MPRAIRNIGRWRTTPAVTMAQPSQKAQIPRRSASTPDIAVILMSSEVKEAVCGQPPLSRIGAEVASALDIAGMQQPAAIDDHPIEAAVHRPDLLEQGRVATDIVLGRRIAFDLAFEGRDIG